ncbi:hypothetical protein [Paraburkholderia sp. SIMBA_053]|uniref:hypothetical protein n=1 Tax=Paraburkholderia sp. SIMBA_053 TaxID=3085794 RepID=UPI0039796C5B
MDQLIESRLRKAIKPFGAYANVSQADGLIYVSGMAGFLDGKLIKGIVGDSIDVEQAAFAARQTMLMTLACLEEALGLEKIRPLHPAHRVFANDKRLRTASGSRQWCLRCFV